MHFGENQLSPGSISISPLPTGHPSTLQRTKVRASTGHYPRFTLPMGSSPGFGSTSSDCGALFRLAFAPAPRLPSLNLATERNSSAHSSIGTPSSSPKEGLRLLVSARFQELFHSPLGVLFTFPSRYWSTIGHQEYLALESGLPSFPPDFSCPVVLRIPAGVGRISPTGLSPPVAGHSRHLRLSDRLLTPVRRSYNPASRRRRFGLLPVRSPLLGEWSLFLGVLRCFSSPGSLHPAYVFGRR
jgi:hypothetical protein